MFRTPAESLEFFERRQRRARAWTCPHGRVLLVGTGVKPGRESCLCDLPGAARAPMMRIPPLSSAVALAQKGEAPDSASGA